MLKILNFRLAIAAYGLRDWDKARVHFSDLIRKFPNCKTNSDAVSWLCKTLKRMKESTQGIYDIERLYKEAYVEKNRRIDVADYRGPIEIAEIPNKGKGFVASKDIKKGTLLLAEKAFSCGYDGELEDEGSLLFLNTIINSAQETSKLLTILGTIQNLRHNPSKAGELYSLYAGPHLHRSNASELEHQFPEG